MLLFYFFGWYAGDLTEALKLNDEAIQMYHNFAKHWMMRGQIFEQQNQMDNARDAYKQGVYTHIVYFFNLFHYVCILVQYYAQYCMYMYYITWLYCTLSFSSHWLMLT